MGETGGEIMINGRRTVGYFFGGITGNLQIRFCRSLCKTAKMYGYDILFFGDVHLLV